MDALITLIGALVLITAVLMVVGMALACLVLVAGLVLAFSVHPVLGFLVLLGCLGLAATADSW